MKPIDFYFSEDLHYSISPLAMRSDLTMSEQRLLNILITIAQNIDCREVKYSVRAKPITIFMNLSYHRLKKAVEGLKNKIMTFDEDYLPWSYKFMNPGAGTIKNPQPILKDSSYYNKGIVYFEFSEPLQSMVVYGKILLRSEK
ncbi:hypothetical protein COB57_02815 [Candidatus Peregrinibacteria bacterium]|nr:MAG: hypothetical protein COB57_02815 [Candidatus Peregrinibacteria bacterium]